MHNFFIGIMSGTSADSLDGCIVSFENEFKLIETESVDFGKNYKKIYEECIKSGYKVISDSSKLLQIEKILDEKSIELVEKLINKSDIEKKKISSIALSGQTVFHTNKRSYQIGNAQEVANASSINVCSDFRNFNIKQGGMGAPLIPAFHKYLYAENDMNKVIFNIGGIANGTYLKGEEISLASDVGPGNCLIDFYASKYYGFPFDNRGEIANQGVINEDLLIKLNESVKNMSYPRADDKNDYYNLVNDSISNVAPENIMRTVTEFTALKIEEFYKYCDSPDQVIFHGGGTKNIYLMDIIQSKIDTNIRTTDDEISSKFVEAAAFAYLAYKNQGIIFKPKL